MKKLPVRYQTVLLTFIDDAARDNQSTKGTVLSNFFLPLLSLFPNAWWLQGQKITKFLKNGQIYLCKYVNLGEGKRSVNTILGPEMDEEGGKRWAAAAMQKKVVSAFAHGRRTVNLSLWIFFYHMSTIRTLNGLNG
jgi:hypothetical protein